MVRPERFELPTLWFEAKCSIQLSYGRRKADCTTTKTNGESAAPQLRCSYRLRRRRHDEHRHLFDDINPCAAKKLVNHRLRQPAGIVLDLHSLLRFVELHAANAVHLANLGHRQGG